MVGCGNGGLFLLATGRPRLWVVFSGSLSFSLNNKCLRDFPYISSHWKQY
jgi:hypothetical protein